MKTQNGTKPQRLLFHVKTDSHAWDKN
jgi:hypothetical protein